MAFVERHERVNKESRNGPPRSAKDSRNRIVLWSSIALVAIVFCVVAAGKVYAVRQQVSCGVTLSKSWDLALHMYSNGHPDKLFPPLSDTPGHLFMNMSDVYPAYVTDKDHPLFCSASEQAFKSLPMDAKFAHSTYVYIGYALQNEDELLAFLDAYPGFIEAGADFQTDLPAPKGRGSFGGDQFIRLNADHRPDGAAVAPSIPVFIEIPNYTDEGPVFRHPTPGG